MRSGTQRAGVALLLVLAGLFATNATAGAAAQCKQKVIADWSDNGRVDRVYALDCYSQALEAMPPEIRDYSDAPEVIDRALTLAVRRQGGERQLATAPPAAASVAQSSGSTAIPHQLFVLGGIGVAMLVVAGLAYAGGRAASGRRGAAR